MPDSKVPANVCPELAENSKLVPGSDVPVADSPVFAEDSELMPESDVPETACPELEGDSKLMPESDVSAPGCSEVAKDPELVPDSDDPAPVADVVSALESEEPLPRSVPVVIVVELPEAPSSDDNPVYDSIFVLDATLLVESFDEEELTSEVDPLEIKPVVMSPCKLVGFEGDIGPPTLDVLPSDKPAVAALPSLVFRLDKVPIVVGDEV